MNVQNEAKIIKDSGDRFDEILCQTILYYLTFTEKVMFECVCKKWRKNIYKKQTKLSITGLDDDDNFDSLNKLQEPIQVTDFNTGAAIRYLMGSVNKRALKTILKKCGNNIEEIYFWCYSDEEVLFDFRDYCPNMTILKISLFGLTGTSLIEYGRSVGHRIEVIEFYHSYYQGKFVKNISRHYPNVKEIYVEQVTEVFCLDEDVFPNLERLNHAFGINQDNFKVCEILSKKYSNTLKRLSIYSEYTLPIDVWRQVLDNISKLTKLEYLYLQMELEDQNRDSKESIDDYITEISNNCPQMKEMTLHLRGNQWDVSTLLACFARFESLVKLNVDFRTESKFKTDISCLKTCKNLKDFSLYTTIDNFDESFFNGIDQSLSSLVELTLEFKSELTDKTIALISGLKNLKSLYVCDIDLKYMKNITDDSICQLLLRCPSINSIEFESNPNITYKTIDTLISCALERPKINIRFECDIAQENEEELDALNINQYANQMPHNLSISGTYFIV